MSSKQRKTYKQSTNIKGQFKVQHIANIQANEVQEIAHLEKKINLLSDIEPDDITQFKELPISKLTLRGLAETNFVEPTKVQRQTLIHSLGGKDIVAASKTGSGKSLAFLIPMLEILYRNRWSSDDGIGAVIISPIRELSYQLYELLNIVGKYHSFSVGLVIGGKDLIEEWNKVSMLNIIICTPGRINHHIMGNCIQLDNLQMLILDEADEILSMGFEKTMKQIFRSLPKSRQTLLFSATQTRDVKELSSAGCRDAVMCFTHENSSSSTPKQLVQAYYVCPLEDKITFLWNFLRDHSAEKILVFVATCKQVRFYANMFGQMDRKMNVLLLHGNLNQQRRMANYDEYCRKEHAIMIATDAAARGLDVPGVDWVVQLDCPDSAKVYIHRVGRTARFDGDGRTVLLMTPAQKDPMLKELAANNVNIQEAERYTTNLININSRLAKILAKDIHLRADAERVFWVYVKAISKMKKEFCDLATIDFDAFASSLGLAKTPNYSFLSNQIKSLQKSDALQSHQEVDKEEIDDKKADEIDPIKQYTIDDWLLPTKTETIQTVDTTSSNKRVKDTTSSDKREEDTTSSDKPVEDTTSSDKPVEDTTSSDKQVEDTTSSDKPVDDTTSIHKPAKKRKLHHSTKAHSKKKQRYTKSTGIET